MKIRSLKSHPQAAVETEGAVGARMRMLIGPEEGAKCFHMRHFEVDPGGNTPHHQHDHEHEILVLAGEGVAVSGAEHRPFQAGDVIFVPANEVHQFRNTGQGPCELLCLIPAPEECCGL